MFTRRLTEYWLAGAIALLGLGLPSSAYAVTVNSPIVEQGVGEIEYQMDYNRDGDPAVNKGSAHQIEVGYGISDRWSMAVNGVYVVQPGGGFTYDRLQWESIYQLFEQGEHWLDAGLYLEYQMPDSKRRLPDVVEFQLLLQKSVPGNGALPAMQHTLNLILKRELGTLARRGAAVGFAWASRWQLSDAFSPGFEYYGEPGFINNFNSPSRQSHQIGPVIYGELGHRFEYQLGYLFGLNKASVNGVLKLVVSCEF